LTYRRPDLAYLTENLYARYVGERLALPDGPMTGANLQVGVVDRRGDHPDPHLFGLQRRA
jgi:hypothetical protein